MRLLKNQLLQIPAPESVVGESELFESRVPLAEEAPALDESRFDAGQPVPRPNGFRERVIEEHGQKGLKGQPGGLRSATQPPKSGKR
jgi:hypothetical protein